MADIIISIPNNKLAEFKLGFLKAHPVTLDEEGNPTMSEIQWVRLWIKTGLISAYRRGKLKLASEGTVIDNNILEA